MPCLLARQSKISVWDAPRQRSEEEEQEEEQRDVKVSNQRFCERISSSSADGGTGSWISPRCSRSYRVLRVGAVVCCGPNLHPQLSSSPPPLPPLICYSSTFLARVVSARDVVPMASAGVSRRFLPRMRSRALFSTLENSSYRAQS